MKIGIFIVSLRAASYSRRIANELLQLASPSFNMEIIEIGQLIKPDVKEFLASFLEKFTAWVKQNTKYRN